MRTMGVDQVAGGFDVAVADWSGEGIRTPVFGGLVSGGFDEGSVRALLTLAAVFAVGRALIDPNPDRRFAASLLSANPQVFAIQEGSQHNAASLAETAYRRATVSGDGGLGNLPTQTAVVGLEPDPVDPGRVVVRAVVRPGEPLPTHVLIPLDGADELDRVDGFRMVEKVLPLALVQTVASGEVVPQVGWPRQTWSLAPTTQLPMRGWSLSLSLYANGALIHEQVVTEGQMLGLANLAPELVREADEWMERTMSLPNGPYTAQFVVYAGQDLVHQDISAGTYADAQTLKGAPMETLAGLTAAWIETNAVEVEQQHPSINLPAPGPFDLPDVTLDTYDYNA